MPTYALMAATLVAYFLLLLVISRHSTGNGGNDEFFRANRRSPWTMVAFGMIGASVSGVSLVSVPGWVAATRMTYLQMCMGFILGYVAVAFVLLPLYYRLRLTSIYSFLGTRFGVHTHRTGTFFFLLSKLTGAAARLYLAVVVLTAFIPLPGGEVTMAAAVLLLIFLYTRRSGIRTLVRTDVLQTACLLLALAGILWAAVRALHLDAAGAWQMIAESPMRQIFEWDGSSKQAFWRQFLSGVFIVVVMTGLDQDMMQKNLTCPTLRQAQKNMCCYGLAFLPINFLLLALGILLYAVCSQGGLTPPAQSDELLPMLVAGGTLGTWVVVPFTIGIVAAALSSADSALTALTTSFCVDFLRLDETSQTAKALRTRRWVHVGMLLAFLLCMAGFRLLNGTNVINAIYVMASYSYGPLLGLFAFGMFTRCRVRDRFVPLVCLCVPLLCGLLDYAAPRLWGFSFGYELLLVSGLLTAFGLLLLRKKVGE